MKTYLTYGSVMAIGNAVLAVVLYLVGFHSDPEKLGLAQTIGGIGGFALAIACIALGTRARRNEIPVTEAFGYGRALGAGIMIALFAGLLGIALTYGYGAVINPGFSEIVVQAEVAKLEAQGKSASEIEAAEKIIRAFTKPGVQAVVGFVAGMLAGTLISLVTAAVLKRPAVPDFAVPPPVA